MVQEFEATFESFLLVSDGGPHFACLKSLKPNKWWQREFVFSCNLGLKPKEGINVCDQLHSLVKGRKGTMDRRTWPVTRSTYVQGAGKST